MRVRCAMLLATLIGFAVPAVASADCVHVVAPGESLTSIAASDGITVDQLAAANGLSATMPLLAGICLTIPPQGGASGVVAASATTAAPAATAPPGPVISGDEDDDGDDGAGASTATASPPSGGSYVVQPGDTLTAIAGRAGTTVSQLAAANGIDPLAPLLAGTVLRLTGSGAPAQQGASSASVSQPVGAAAEGSAASPPYPTSERLSAGEIGQIASDEGVPPALAEAIAWQESGFNNGLVSSADARGIMQILPGTWQWIGQQLATPPPLGPASATQNVRAGALLLRSLLQATGGNQQLAAAGYFQGLPSVEQNGMYPATQQYVNDVMSLEQQFGGG
jgi:LysM repeat protein